MDNNLTYRQVKNWHIDYVARHMRQSDADEIRFSVNKSPGKGLRDSVEVSEYSGTVLDSDNVPLLTFGLAPICKLTGVGAPWLLGTDESLKHKRSFIADGRDIIGRMLKVYPNLQNYVYVENEVSVRWLKAMGFTMDESVVLPQSGKEFMKFHMSKES